MSLALATGDTITGVAGSATSITYTISGDEIAAGADAFKVLAQGQLPSTVGTLYTVPASTEAIVKTIHLANMTGGTVTARLNVKGTAAANAILPPISILAGGFAVYADDGWRVYNDQGQLLSVGATGATGQTGAPGDMTNPMTTAGDIIVGGASPAGTPERLAVGSATQLLHGGTTPAYGAVLPADLDVSADNTTADATTGHHGLLPKLGGGTTDFLRADGTWAPGGSSTVASDPIWDAAGDLAVGTGADTAAKLAVGAENTVLAVVSGVPAWVARTALPTLTQAVVSAFAASGTTAVATMGSTPTNGNYLYAVIGSTGRGCDSITQTNVSWAKIYSGNGNSQYFELWKGTVSASAGTSVTANFTGSNKQEIAVAEWGTLNLSTAGTAKTITSASGTAPSFWTVPLATAPGDYVIVGISANVPSSQELKVPIARLPWNPTGGQECACVGRSPGGSIVAWGSISSSVAYFGAMFVLS